MSVDCKKAIREQLRRYLHSVETYSNDKYCNAVCKKYFAAAKTAADYGLDSLRDDDCASAVEELAEAASRTSLALVGFGVEWVACGQHL